MTIQDDEQNMIMDAAYRCLVRSEGTTVSITDILDAAGLSTRAFYRHFASKDSLLLAMWRRDSERVMAELTAAAQSAPTARAALRGWIDGMLNLMAEEPRRRRALILSSEEARRARGYGAERARFRAAHEAALAALLDRGRADGSFPWADPAADAEQIQAVLGQALDTQLHQSGRTAREAADRIADFAFRALGATPHP